METDVKPEETKEPEAAVIGDIAARVIPLEAAKAQLRHWWREPLAGFIAVAAGLYDVWYKGRDTGLTISLDEILILGGIVLIAGSKQLFNPKALTGKPEPPEKP